MSFNRRVFYIEEISLAEALGIEHRELDEIVDFLQKETDEDIRITESLHFVVQGYINRQQYPIRIFSREGALAVANYLDLQGKTTKFSIKRVVELLEKYRIIRIDGKVRRAIYRHSSSLVLRNERHWLSREDVARIFATSTSRLDKAFQDIQRSDSPMRINEDFGDFDYASFFSLSGLAKLSTELSLRLRSKERRDYCKRVKEVAPPVVKILALSPSPSQQDIDRAVRYAKNRDEFCQITGVTRDKYENRLIKLVGHHLYDKNTYRFLADQPDNILTIAEYVSEDFHQWNGGNDKTCTIDDFIEYVEQKYSQKHEVILMLHNRRRILMLKLTQLQRRLPEGQQ
ncbi:hypothetical protein PN462_08540 [Spirulina sp. CS-785/01]|uniref:hypothetical protein n=1 Tax=Spirulina sp. CS-785/01 TaxID=3021716 RepID=UPI00232C2C5B|nr:hypothetical protein [Spirulina sp. CS-785/01]MDB9313147.1 hypothetical protein [Spirulina sp. CS-785/01]